MRDESHCDNCGQVWAVHALDPIQDDWGRVKPGGVVPLGNVPTSPAARCAIPPPAMCMTWSSTELPCATWWPGCWTGRP